MKNFTRQSSIPSREKNDPGFVKIRRGLLPHLPWMTSNATKLYLWLHLRAYWQGPKRGTVETTFDDIARALDWKFKMVQRTLDELLHGSYITLQRASNQYELTQIVIEKYDPESNSAVDSSVQSKNSAVDTGVDTRVHGSVHSSHLSSLSPKELDAPKKSKEIKKGEDDAGEDHAVRRRFDAELHSPTKSVFSPSEKEQKLSSRLAASIEREGEAFRDVVEHCARRGAAHPFGQAERRAFARLHYQPDLQSPLLSMGFVDVVVDVVSDPRGENLTPGILCCVVIDRCREREGILAPGLSKTPRSFEGRRAAGRFGKD